MAECPVSLVTRKSTELVQIHARAKRMDGAPLFGPDLSEWPAWAVDAFEALEIESVRLENARMEAEMKRD